MKNSATTTLVSSDQKPTIMITNDDGIDAPGLRALVRVLVSTTRYVVLVCAPDMENSAVSHSITWRHPISARRADIDGATAFAVSGTPVDCTSLGISQALFPSVPDLVISGINKVSNIGHHIVYSGQLQVLERPSFMEYLLSLYHKSGKSSIRDFTLAAEACLPIINTLLDDIRNQTHPDRCFLNIDVPAEVANHKAKIAHLMILTQTGRFFGTDMHIMVTPLAALSNAEADCQAYHKGWLQNIAESLSSSAL